MKKLSALIICMLFMLSGCNSVGSTSTVFQSSNTQPVTSTTPVEKTLEIIDNTQDSTTIIPSTLPNIDNVPIIKNVKWIIPPQIIADDIQPFRTDLPYSISSAFFNYKILSEIIINGKSGAINYKGEIVIPTSADVSVCIEGLVGNDGRYIYREDGLLLETLAPGHSVDMFFFDVTTKKVCCIANDDSVKYLSSEDGNSAYSSYILQAIKTFAAEEDDTDFEVLDYYLYVNGKNELLSNIEYEYGTNFSEKLAVTKKDGKWGFIDKNAREVILFVYDYAYNFSDGFAAVCHDGKWGFIDKSNKTVVEFAFDELRPTASGNAWAKLNGGWGVISVV